MLDDSLNNGAIEVMRRLGKDPYYQNLLAFGIGSPTGIDVAGEVNQPLRQQRVWTDVDYATASFGQQVQTTPVSNGWSPRRALTRPKMTTVPATERKSSGSTVNSSQTFCTSA